MEPEDNLTDDEVQDAILEIIAAKKITLLPVLDEASIYVQPESETRLISAFLEKQKYNKYKKDGFLTEDELNKDHLDSFWTIKDQEDLEEIQSKIDSYKKLLKKRQKGSTTYLEDLAKKINLESKEASLLHKRMSGELLTAEYKAREDRYQYLLVESVRNLDGSRKWRDVDDFLTQLTNLDSFYIILNDFLKFYFGRPTAQIRQIARSDQWRNYYIGSSKGYVSSLFSRESKDLSLDQLNLMAWSSWYTSIYEMSYDDRPSQEVIDSDEKLDVYMKEYSRKIEAESEIRRKEKRFRSKSKGNTKGAFEHNHVIVTAGSKDYIDLHKKEAYSDTKIISGRSSDDHTHYSDSEEALRIRKKQIKNRGRRR